MPTVFLYGTSLPGQPDHGWVADLRRTAATVRGRLWCDRKRRPVLVPDAKGRPIHGVLVEIPEERLGVLDFVDASLPRVRLRVSRNLRSVEAWAWALDAATARKRGYRPMEIDTWT